MRSIASFQIIDDVEEAKNIGAIEVEISLKNGEKRWCFFMTPLALQNCGDFLPGTNIRIHLGCEYMIVLSEVSEKNIGVTLEYLDKNNILLETTKKNLKKA